MFHQRLSFNRARFAVHAASHPLIRLAFRFPPLFFLHQTLFFPTSIVLPFLSLSASHERIRKSVALARTKRLALIRQAKRWPEEEKPAVDVRTVVFSDQDAKGGGKKEIILLCIDTGRDRERLRRTLVINAESGSRSNADAMHVWGFSAEKIIGDHGGLAMVYPNTNVSTSH